MINRQGFINGAEHTAKIHELEHKSFDVCVYYTVGFILISGFVFVSGSIIVLGILCIYALILIGCNALISRDAKKLKLKRGV